MFISGSREKAGATEKTFSPYSFTHSLTHSLTHSGPRVPKVAHGASERVLHCCRSSAHRLAVSRLTPHSFSSLTIVLLQVTLGLPLLRLPWGLHLNATLGTPPTLYMECTNLAPISPSLFMECTNLDPISPSLYMECTNLASKNY